MVETTELESVTLACEDSYEHKIGAFVSVWRCLAGMRGCFFSADPVVIVSIALVSRSGSGVWVSLLRGEGHPPPDRTHTFRRGQNQIQVRGSRVPSMSQVDSIVEDNQMNVEKKSSSVAEENTPPCSISVFASNAPHRSIMEVSVNNIVLASHSLGDLGMISIRNTPFKPAGQYGWFGYPLESSQFLHEFIPVKLTPGQNQFQLAERGGHARMRISRLGMSINCL